MVETIPEPDGCFTYRVRPGVQGNGLITMRGRHRARPRHAAPRSWSRRRRTAALGEGAPEPAPGLANDRARRRRRRRQVGRARRVLAATIAAGVLTLAGTVGDVGRRLPDGLLVAGRQLPGYLGGLTGDAIASLAGPALAGLGPRPADGEEAVRTDTTDPAGPAPAPARPADDGHTAAERRLVERATNWSADISPKSVIATPAGLFFAQNMMYSHNITVYDREAHRVATIEDEVRLADFGITGYDGTHRGAPVEAAADHRGRYVYVSNYQMYGEGFANPGNDGCGAGGWDDSFLYRVSVRTLAIDQVIPVGSVPKYVAVTGDDRRVLVSNWCSYDLSVVDTASGRELRRVPLGAYPRGIAVDDRRGVAYVAIMGGYDIAIVDLTTYEVDWISGAGSAPRHLVLDPSGRYLYATLNGEGTVAKIDIERREVLERSYTGSAPRSMDISADGTALYVVNYFSSTVSKVRTADMAVLQELPVADQPIGIAYDEGSRSVWVALYAGAIAIFDDETPPDR